MWKLALSVPLDYVDDVHPFDLNGDAEPLIFQLSNDTAGAAVEVVLAPGQRIRDRFNLRAPEKGGRPFRVVMDGVELRRPLRFTGLYSTEKPEDRPLLFVGSWSPPLGKIPSTTSGGQELSFEGYMLWTPRVIPAENAGLLTRIADASGILFDERFMDYPIAELTRLRQTSAELFVHRGLDAALNIDRESFNSGHPHAKLVRHWVHQALRQLATTQKRIAAEERARKQVAAKEKEIGAVDKLVTEKLAEVGVHESAAVEISDKALIVEVERRRGTLAYDQKTLLDKLKPTTGSKAKSERELQKRKLRAIARLLDGFGAFENMDFAKQQELLNGIARIVWGSVDE